MAVNPFRTSVRRLATSAARAATSMTPREMTSYHEHVSKAQGVVESLTGGTFPAAGALLFRQRGHPLTGPYQR